jgi:hypothetical protein
MKKYICVERKKARYFIESIEKYKKKTIDMNNSKCTVWKIREKVV